MKKANFQEDDIIHIVAEFLKAQSFLILAQGGNQAGSFRFALNLQKTKAPDLVAFRETTILVCEAKVKASSLFSVSKNSSSDLDSILYLMNSEKPQSEVKSFFERKLPLLNIPIPNETQIRGCLIAGNSFKRYLYKILSPKILLLSVDTDNSRVVVEQDIYNLLTQA